MSPQELEKLSETKEDRAAHPFMVESAAFHKAYPEIKDKQSVIDYFESCGETFREETYSLPKFAGEILRGKRLEKNGDSFLQSETGVVFFKSGGQNHIPKGFCRLFFLEFSQKSQKLLDKTAAATKISGLSSPDSAEPETTKLKFGKYKGKTLEEVARIDIRYLQWAASENVQGLRRQIEKFLNEN